MRHRWMTLCVLFSVFAVTTAAVVFDLTVRGRHRYPVLEPVLHVPQGDAEQGREAIVAYGCGSCHVIPGVRMATGRVGPQLIGFREQIYVAGVLPNIPTNLIEWIQNPRDVNPLTAMPDLEVTESDARNIAAYLYQTR